MSNVIAWPTHVQREAEQPTPQNVLRRLRGLLTAGYLDRDAFFLGTHVVGLCIMHGTRECAISMRQATTTLVRVNGTGIFAGVVTDKRSAFVQAMQQLHFSALILNDYDLSSLDADDAQDRHFTRSPDVAGGEPWGEDSLIYFRLPALPTRTYEETIDAMVAEAFSRCQYIIDFPLE